MHRRGLPCMRGTARVCGWYTRWVADGEKRTVAAATATTGLQPGRQYPRPVVLSQTLGVPVQLPSWPPGVA